MPLQICRTLDVSPAADRLPPLVTSQSVNLAFCIYSYLVFGNLLDVAFGKPGKFSIPHHYPHIGGIPQPPKAIVFIHKKTDLFVCQIDGLDE